jgi:hypothetical protein
MIAPIVIGVIGLALAFWPGKQRPSLDSERVWIHLTAEQYRRLEIAARQSGKSKSKWIEEMARALPFQKGQN